MSEHTSIVKSVRSISQIQTFFHCRYLTNFLQGIQLYHQKFKKMHVNVLKSHLSLQYNFKKNTLWNIKNISQCNDESLEPTSSTESFFDRIGTCGTVQPKSEPTFPFQYMSNVGRPITPLLGEMKIYVHYVFVGNLIFNNFCLKHFSI